MKQHILTAIATLSLLTACGGGGGDDNAPADKPNNNTAGKTYFMPDDPVEPDGDDAWNDYNGYTISRNGSTFVNGRFGKGTTVNTASVPKGFAEFPAQMTFDPKKGGSTKENVNIRSYQGFYSGVFAIGGTGSLVRSLEVDAAGLPYLEPTKTLPNAGKATYSGRAFDTDPAHDATLRYTIDFGSRRGSGEISASRGLGRMTLNEASIRHYSGEESEFGTMAAYGVKGSRTLDGSNNRGTYAFAIAGPNAEEIVGYADIDDDRELSLHGTRGAISQ